MTLPRVDDPILNRALEMIDEDLEKIARMEIIGLDWSGDQGATNIHINNIVSGAITQHEGDIDHNALTNFLANKHIDHTGVSISAGGILSGGGTIAANRTISLAHGDVDHDQLANYVANKHINWLDATQTFKNTGLMQVANVGAPGSAPANMAQFWSQDVIAGHAQLHYMAEGGIARPLGDLYDVRDWGMIPNDNTGFVPADNVTAFDVMVGAMSAGDVMYFSKGTWYIDDDFDVTQAGITIRGN